MPTRAKTETYFRHITGQPAEEHLKKKSYVPIVELPSDALKIEQVLSQVSELHNDGKEYGGTNAFNYLLGELVDNVYEHSGFKKAYIMAQQYPKLKFTEIAILDNGIGIPGSYKKTGLDVPEPEAIYEALEGHSTKGSERGYGLWTSLRLITKGLNGEFMLVSGKAAAHFEGESENLYSLAPQLSHEGTFINMRIPYPCKTVNPYDYL